jgi:DNA transformation protein
MPTPWDTPIKKSKQLTVFPGPDLIKASAWGTAQRAEPGVEAATMTDNMLYLRVDDYNRAAFKEAESFPPLSYEKQGCTIDLSFWRAPERLFDEPDELVTWARVALAAARRVAANRERTSRGRKSKPQLTWRRAFDERGVETEPWSSH